MNDEERPVWLIRQENGVLAEARTRAFLLERFWILERSVDIEGADFIIQRRLTRRSLLDIEPSRLGYIQSKYYADSHTCQYIHREYLLDPAGQPRKEFFVLCHTGKADSAERYVLSASEIVTSFRELPPEHSRAGRFALPGSEVLTHRYRIGDCGFTLDRIERALAEADFHKNRRFFAWALPSVDREEPPIAEEYWAPIENWWGDIPTGLKDMRVCARKLRETIEEVRQNLITIETASDPQLALSAADDIRYEHGDSIRIDENLWDPDFSRAVDYHNKRYQLLKSSDLLSAYTTLRRAVNDFVNGDLAPRMPLGIDDVYIIQLEFDRKTLQKLQLTTRIATITELSIHDPLERHVNPCDVLSSSQGSLEVYLLAARYSYEAREKRERIQSPRAWHERIKWVVEIATDEIMKEVLNLRFSQELDFDA